MVTLIDPTTFIFIHVHSAFMSGQISYQIVNLSRYQNTLNLTFLPSPTSPPSTLTASNRFSEADWELSLDVCPD